MNGYPSVSGIGLQPGPVCSVLLGSQGQNPPVAGADFAYTIPDVGAVYEIIAIRARFVTSAAVANRGVAVTVKDAAGTEVFRGGFDTAVTASLTTIFTFSEYAASATGGVTTTKAVAIELPEGPYLPRWVIGSNTTAIDVADQWSQVAVWYRALYAGGEPYQGDGPNNAD